jgi:hypothetical protein
MMKKFIILSLIYLTSCAGNTTLSRHELLAQHPEWDADIRNLIKHGMIAKGMTEEQLNAAWGAPCYSCEGTTLIGKTKSLEYGTRIVFFNNQGLVSEWEIK